MIVTTRASDIPVVHRARSASRRIVFELVVVAVLAGIGAQFPRDVDAGTAWNFLAAQWSALAHALLGAVLLVEAVAFLVRPGWVGTPLLRALGGAGLACITISVGSGIAYVALRQPSGALLPMTLGWIGGLATYSIAWFCFGRRKSPST